MFVIPVVLNSILPISAYAITKIYKDVISNMQDQIYGERLHYIELTYFQ